MVEAGVPQGGPARTRGVAPEVSAQRACERSNERGRGAAGSPDPALVHACRAAGSPDPALVRACKTYGSPDAARVRILYHVGSPDAALVRILYHMGSPDPELLHVNVSAP